jgi:hypothetical protein
VATQKWEHCKQNIDLDKLTHTFIEEMSNWIALYKLQHSRKHLMGNKLIIKSNNKNCHGTKKKKDIK